MWPHKEFQELFNNWFHICGTIIGHEILDPNFKLNSIMLIIVETGMFTLLVSSIYTIFAFDLQLALKSIVILGIVGQVSQNERI